MADLKIFSYLPNPRVFKATITARLLGVELDIVGSKPAELANWLWDFDARELTADERTELANAQGDNTRQARAGFTGQLAKTDAFMAANPYGTVPVAFSPDGTVGIFESNSIMRAVARLGGSSHKLYGTDAYTAARIDSFLDTSLVFARDSQIYLLALGAKNLTADIYQRAQSAFVTYLAGLEQSLTDHQPYLTGSDLTLADICAVCELALFYRERSSEEYIEKQGFKLLFSNETISQNPHTFRLFANLLVHKAFAPDIGAYMDKIR